MDDPSVRAFATRVDLLSTQPAVVFGPLPEVSPGTAEPTSVAGDAAVGACRSSSDTLSPAEDY